MDNNDTKKALHRSTPSSNSNLAVSSAGVPGSVPPAQFYGSKSPPPLPSRSKNLGSSHTKVIRPNTPPPDYSALRNSPFREPQLVEEAAILEDPVPALLPAADHLTSWANGNGWETTTKGWDNDSWNTAPTSVDNNAAWSQYDSGGYNVTASKLIDIDGRDTQEEESWWDPSVRERYKRPGPGVLPPCLAERLHNPEHSLFSVSVNMPDIKPDARLASTSRDGADFGPSFDPPSSDDLIRAIPHPNAYYCRKHNGWVLLQWKSSSMLPPLARSFVPDPSCPFPDLARRKRTSTCVGEIEQPFGPANKTHHFHYYEKAVDAHKLDPAFRRTGWEKVDQKKERRRKITSLNLDEIAVHSILDDNLDEDMEEEEGDLLDLYVCCQCSVYCIVSNVIPGVIPVKFMDEYTRDRWDNPPPTRNREESVISGLETFLLYVLVVHFSPASLNYVQNRAKQTMEGRK